MTDAVQIRRTFGPIAMKRPAKGQTAVAPTSPIAVQSYEAARLKQRQ